MSAKQSSNKGSQSSTSHLSEVIRTDAKQASEDIISSDLVPDTFAHASGYVAISGKHPSCGESECHRHENASKDAIVFNNSSS
jgi:hypothetical protein